MKKSKIIFLFSLSLFIVYYVYYNITFPKKSLYNKDTNYIEGIVTNIKYYDNKISFILKSNENILVNDYNKISNIRLGYKVKVNGSIKEPSSNTNFNLFNYKNYLLSKRINYTFTLENISILSYNTNFLYKIKNKIIDRLDSIDNSYLYTFLLADNRIDDEVYKYYQNNGISHLFAVSGMHISLISFIMLFILNKIIKRRKISYLLVSLFLLFFMFLTGFTASVIRSSLIFIITALSMILNKKANNLLNLYILMIILLLYNPYYIYDVGFIYSFIISISLIIFKDNINSHNNYFIKLFITSLIAFIVSIPITITNNFFINLLSPFLNLIFVPFISFIVFPLSLVTIFIPYLNPILVFFLNILEFLASFFARYSINLILCYIPIYVVIIYYIVIYLMLKKTNKVTVSIFIIMICIHYNIKLFINYPIVTMIDVGQGDSFLIELPNNKGNILIDTGGNKNYDLGINVIIPYLKSRGIKKLDYLVLSHGDFDHMGASISLVNSYKVCNVLMNSGNNNELEEELINLLTNKKINYEQINNKKLNISGNIFNFLNILNSKEENNDSIITYVKLNHYGILFMGDATFEEENYLLENYDLDVDILKIGHHGSKYSTGDNFIDRLLPDYALISVGANNYYGHPSDRVIDLLDNYNVNNYLTSIDGSVKLVLGKKMYIYTCLNGR